MPKNTLTPEPFLEPVYPEGIPKGTRRHLKKKKIVRFQKKNEDKPDTNGLSLGIQAQVDAWQGTRNTKVSR
jgi:hypothetical protein